MSSCRCASSALPDKSALEIHKNYESGLKSLSLFQFRNHSDYHIDTNNKTIVLTGPNGAGKTNILEAISLFSPGRGFRHASLDEMAHKDSGKKAGFAVAARFADDKKHLFDMTTGLGPGTAKRYMEYNKSRLYRQSELASLVRISWLLPQMNRLFLDGRGARRRLIDRMVYGVDAAHAGHVGAYEELARQRQKLLQKPNPDPDWLDVMEQRMARRALAIMTAREEMRLALNRICAEERDIFPPLAIWFEGRAEKCLEEYGANEERLAQAFKAARAEDRICHRTSFGPQRLAVRVRHLHNQMLAEQCSTGEQKMLLLSLILGQAELLLEKQGGPPAILLLDEVCAHLDEKRCEALFERVNSMNLQAFYTGTEQKTFTPLTGKAQFFVLENDLYYQKKETFGASLNKDETYHVVS